MTTTTIVVSRADFRGDKNEQILSIVRESVRCLGVVSKNCPAPPPQKTKRENRHQNGIVLDVGARIKRNQYFERFSMTVYGRIPKTAVRVVWRFPSRFSRWFYFFHRLFVSRVRPVSR